MTLVLCYLAIFSSAWFSNIHLQVQLFGLNIYPEDAFVSLNFFGIMIPKYSRIGDAKRVISTKIGFLLLTITVVGTFSWVHEYGLKSGVNHWRQYLFDFSIFLYCAKAYVEWTNRRVLMVSIIPAIILSFLAITKILNSGLGRTDGVDPLTGFQTGRPTTAEGSFILLMAFVICLHFSSEEKILRVILLSTLATLVLLLQHRTVWISAISVGLLWILFPQKGVRNFKRVSKFILISCIGWLSYVLTKHITNLSAATSNTDTFEWRVDRWVRSFAIPRSAIQWIFGATFGPTPVTGADGPFRVFAHNAYVDLIENIGYFGCVLLILLLIRPLLAPNLIHSAAGRTQVTLILASLVYGFTYAIPRPSFVLLGILVAYIAQQHTMFETSALNDESKSGSVIT